MTSVPPAQQTQPLPPQQQQQPPQQQGQAGQLQQQPQLPMAFPQMPFAVPQQQMSSGVSLWVGNLDSEVDENVLFSEFTAVVPSIISLKVVRDKLTNQSRGYGYVNFYNKDDANKAKEELHGKTLRSRAIRVMDVVGKTQRNPAANLYIKNLTEDINSKAVESTFKKYGDIMSCFVPLDDKTRACKGYGYVQFKNVEDAEKAIKKVNGKEIKGKVGGKESTKKLIVEHFKKSTDRKKADFTNIFIKNIPEGFDEDAIVKEFTKFGEITSSFLSSHKTKDDVELPFCFVNFKNSADASKAIEEMNNKNWPTGEGNWYVSRAQSKKERTALMRKEKVKSYRFNMYVKFLSTSTTEEELKKAFNNDDETAVESVRIPQENGEGKGYGYVSFSSKEFLEAALTSPDKVIIDGKPVEVQPHKTRGVLQQERRSKYFQPAAIPQHLANLPPQFQQMFLQQAMQMIMPMFRPMMPNQMMRPAMRGGMTAPRQMQPRMQQQQFQQRQNNMRMMPNQMGMQGAQMNPMQQQQPQQQPQQQQQPAKPATQQDWQAFKAALTPMAPKEQKAAVGDKLYPKVGELDSARASKITGMLLEMDTAKVLEMLENPAILQKNVKQAQHILDKNTKN